MFEFLNHKFDQETFTAHFYYRDINSIEYQETIKFTKTDFDFLGQNAKTLDRALDLAHIIIGVSYYKSHPTSQVTSSYALDSWQANFFNKVYQEGLSQFAYENDLTRDNLAHFQSSTPDNTLSENEDYYHAQGILAGESGGKDSLLVSKILQNNQLSWTGAMISSTNNYPKILDHIGAQKLQIIIRKIDTKNLQKANGLNGHVPITYINMAILLVQAILNGDSIILTSIGHEGAEPHAFIGDLLVNHQWSKTWEAEQLFADYTRRYISKNIKIGSPIRQFSELKIAELFVKNCWAEYGHQFSSCNVANYKQGNDNSKLSWCGLCAKCANSYLLFAPFLEPKELDSIFESQESLFEKPELADDFKGLLGLDGIMKPFECVGEIDELRAAYHMKKPGYKNLPFDIPASTFDYRKEYTAQNLLELNYAK